MVNQQHSQQCRAAYASETRESCTAADSAGGACPGRQVTLSIVVPCYNEEECLPLFLSSAAQAVREIMTAYPGTTVELVLVDDGSTDGTAALLQRAAAGDDGRAAFPFAIRWLSLSRNFGKEGALLAGLDAARGAVVAVMDADLQDPPSLLPRMFAMLADDPTLDCVATRRTTRAGEPPIRSICAHAFYRLMNTMSPVAVPDGARDYRMMRRRVVDALTSLTERNRFSKGLYAWVGFHTAWIDYPNTRRAAGKSSWNFFALVRYAIEGLISCSTVPLAVASYIGLLLCAVAFGATCFIAVRAAMFGDPVAGWPSLACIITFIGGLQLMCLGIIGRYLANTYLESKRRPNYIVRDGNINNADICDTDHVCRSEHPAYNAEVRAR
ncbi:glycosyltransferase [Bifidobacterium reuteri]|uniref:Glycosyltransferase n=1 Tax=Bifidobacterium reuteri TaxID=983706 RepID=A0A5J5E2Q9_9BIFI|nr:MULTISPECIES: glycosyltransferase family 2 protein [Bifidobacterium]KAA8818588.1 glycosyltransferase [Bifidobacterium rousetti]KAA8823358.1 glycosyltransferase [Bifidobacterium reuteri]